MRKAIFLVFLGVVLLVNAAFFIGYKTAPETTITKYDHYVLKGQDTIINKSKHSLDLILTKETFHDYLIVEGKRVIHVHNCKCKKK